MRARSAASSGRAVRTLSARSSMGARVRQSRTPCKSHFAANAKFYDLMFQSTQKGLFLNPCQELRALLAALAVMLRRGPVGNLREMRRDVVGRGAVTQIDPIGLHHLGGGEYAGRGGENHP